MTPKKFRSGPAEDFNSVISAWRAGIQIDMDVSTGVLANLDAGYPCRHDERRLSSFVSERELKQHFAVKSACSFSSFGCGIAMLGQLQFAEARNRVVPHDFPHNVGLQ
jgi:hypothetical protein